MISLLDSGAYLIRGSEIIPDNAEASAAITAKTGKTITVTVVCCVHVFVVQVIRIEIHSVFVAHFLTVS